MFPRMSLFSIVGAAPVTEIPPPRIAAPFRIRKPSIRIPGPASESIVTTEPPAPPSRIVGFSATSRSSREISVPANPP